MVVRIHCGPARRAGDLIILANAVIGQRRGVGENCCGRRIQRQRRIIVHDQRLPEEEGVNLNPEPILTAHIGDRDGACGHIHAVNLRSDGRRIENKVLFAERIGHDDIERRRVAVIGMRDGQRIGQRIAGVRSGGAGFGDLDLRFDDGDSGLGLSQAAVEIEVDHIGEGCAVCNGHDVLNQRRDFHFNHTARRAGCSGHSDRREVKGGHGADIREARRARETDVRRRGANFGPNERQGRAHVRQGIDQRQRACPLWQVDRDQIGDRFANNQCPASGLIDRAFEHGFGDCRRRRRDRRVAGFGRICPLIRRIVRGIAVIVQRRGVGFRAVEQRGIAQRRLKGDCCALPDIQNRNIDANGAVTGSGACRDNPQRRHHRRWVQRQIGQQRIGDHYVIGRTGRGRVVGDLNGVGQHIACVGVCGRDRLFDVQIGFYDFDDLLIRDRKVGGGRVWINNRQVDLGGVGQRGARDILSVGGVNKAGDADHDAFVVVDVQVNVRRIVHIAEINGDQPVHLTDG